MKKKLTEREAWAMLAEKWSKPFKDLEGDYSVDVGNGDCSGLCASVYDLHITGQINSTVYDRMNAVIPDPAKMKRVSIYVWPLDLDGARSRAKFCSAQVRRLSKKKVKQK